MSRVSKGCKVCASWHETAEADAGDCGHWCHFAGAEDWDADGGGEADGDE